MMLSIINIFILNHLIVNSRVILFSKKIPIKINQ